MRLRIDDYMTHTPHSINSGMSLATARKLMRKYGVRHLPVQVAGHLVGVVTERDLLLGASLDKDGKLLVDDIMTPDPYTVRSGSSLGEAVEAMATGRYGCAIVCDAAGRATGIFTAVDALRAMADMFNTRSRKAALARGTL